MTDHVHAPAGAGAWHLLDLAVIGAVGVCLGMLVAAVANHRQAPAPDVFAVPDSPAALIDDRTNPRKG